MSDEHREDEHREIEPDYRYTLAAERTYLAYVRTSLALIAAGVAVVAVFPEHGAVVRRGLALLLVLAGLVVGITGRRRLLLVDRAIRRGDPLPTSGLATWISAIMVGVAVIGAVLVFVF